MSRGLTSEQLAAVAEEVVRCAYLITLTLDSGTTRVTTAPADVTIDGNTWLGGKAVEVSGIDEASDTSAAQITAALSGIPTDMIMTVLSEPLQNRRAEVSLVLFDADWVPLDPIVLFRGRIDQSEITLGSTARVALTITNHLADWSRAKLRRFSDEEHQARHAGDLGFQTAAAMATREIVWPNKTWFRNHPGI